MKNYKVYLQKPLARAVDTVLCFYQNTLSLDHGPLVVGAASAKCRFFPSCSEYARRAIRQYGLRRGFVLSVKRIFRCHPWHPGGYDPL